ncbi:MAG TPA: SGNH/GDSL hydrolase family protein [Catenuloplanes sp.]
MSRKTLALAWFIVPAVLAGTGVVATGVPVASAATSTVDYVALGDSYSSGVGAPDASGPCGRSPSGYPARWAAQHPTASLRFVACGGATTDDVRRDQLAALDGGTDLVSITIGGNDAGFFPTVMLCASRTDAACEQQVTTARSTISQVLPGKLDATYQAIRGRAPNATVVVLGYPRLFEPNADCPTGGMSTFKRRVLNSGADHLARVIADRARAAGFTFADVRSAFTGHGICSPAAWINNVSTTRLADSFHPNVAGYEQGYLPAFSVAAGVS